MARGLGFFGAVALGAAVCAGTAQAGTLDEVRARDRLVCGVSEGLRGFSEKDVSGSWSGFDVDFCRAVAAAALGDPDKVDFVPLSTTARFASLAEGKIDVLSRNTSWTFSRDVRLGLDFAGVSYFDGQGFLVPALFGMTSVTQLEGAVICVLSGTTTEENAAAHFAAAGINVTFRSYPERAQARAAYQAQTCDAYTADRSALASERSLLDDPDDHVLLRESISKEPLGPVTREDDPKWTDLVRWTLYALINAEEAGLDSQAAAGERRAEAVAMGAHAVAGLGLAEDWLAKVLASTGNYGEIFERNLGADTPLGLGRGMNALWSEGGLIYAPPMS